MGKPKVYGNVPRVEVTDKPEVQQYDYCFNLVKDKNGVRVAIGNQIVTPHIFATVEEAKAYVDSKPWGLIVATVDICQQIIHKQNNK